MNILGLGTDIENVERFKKYSKDDKFIKRIFSEKEIEYCYSNQKFYQHLAGRFCAKEAFIKALRGKTSFQMNKIEVLNDADGVPNMQVIDSEFNDIIHLSISHTDELAQATVIIEKAP